jgi:hypothetical protein
MVWDRDGAELMEAPVHLGWRLGGLALMQQAALLDGLAHDAFTFG